MSADYMNQLTENAVRNTEQQSTSRVFKYSVLLVPKYTYKLYFHVCIYTVVLWISWIADDLLASQEGLCSMQLVGCAMNYTAWKYTDLNMFRLQKSHHQEDSQL
jgi:hypothetical protein